jgi:hypothetical protein
MSTILKTLQNKGWKITKTKESCFTYIKVTSPQGYTANVSSIDRNPSNVLYLLGEEIFNITESENKS